MIFQRQVKEGTQCKHEKVIPGIIVPFLCRLCAERIITTEKSATHSVIVVWSALQPQLSFVKKGRARNRREGKQITKARHLTRHFRLLFVLDHHQLDLFFVTSSFWQQNKEEKTLYGNFSFVGCQAHSEKEEAIMTVLQKSKSQPSSTGTQGGKK